LGKFNLICTAGIFLSVTLLTVQVHRFNVNAYLANLISIVAVSVWNFLMNQRFAWSNANTSRRPVSSRVEGPDAW
jgi:dolichol-phosphate mannosyltransferase